MKLTEADKAFISSDTFLSGSESGLVEKKNIFFTGVFNEILSTIVFFWK